MHHTWGTNHMCKWMSQLRQVGLQSLITSMISLITYSIMHFPSSSVPYFFPSTLCLRLKNFLKEFHPLRCIPLIVFSSGNKDRGKKVREVGRSDKARKGGRTTRSHSIGWGCNELKWDWFEQWDQLTDSHHDETDDCNRLRSETRGDSDSKIKRSIFSVNAL